MTSINTQKNSCLASALGMNFRQLASANQGRKHNLDILHFDVLKGNRNISNSLVSLVFPSPASLPCLSQPEIYEHLIGVLAVGKINIASPKE